MQEEKNEENELKINKNFTMEEILLNSEAKLKNIEEKMITIKTEFNTTKEESIIK